MNYRKELDRLPSISGMDTEYEDICKDMLAKGLEWLDSHPNANPIFSNYKSIFGIAFEENFDAQELSRAITIKDCSGAQHHKVIQHLIHIRNVGWERHKKEWTEINELSSKDDKS